MSEQAVDKIDTTRYSRNLRGRVWDRGLGFISVFGSARVAVGTGHAPVAGSPALRQSRSSETTPAGRQSPSSKTHPRPARVPHSETSPAPPAADKLPSPTALYRRVPGQGSLEYPSPPPSLLVGYSSGKFFRKLYTFPALCIHVVSAHSIPNTIAKLDSIQVPNDNYHYRNAYCAILYYVTLLPSLLPLL